MYVFTNVKQTSSKQNAEEKKLKLTFSHSLMAGPATQFPYHVTMMLCYRFWMCALTDAKCGLMWKVDAKVRALSGDFFSLWVIDFFLTAWPCWVQGASRLWVWKKKEERRGMRNNIKKLKHVSERQKDATVCPWPFSPVYTYIRESCCYLNLQQLGLNALK